MYVWVCVCSGNYMNLNVCDIDDMIGDWKGTLLCNWYCMCHLADLCVWNDVHAHCAYFMHVLWKVPAGAGRSEDGYDIMCC